MDRASPQAVLPHRPFLAVTIGCLQTEPWRHGFFPLMRRIATDQNIEPVGSAPLPEAECFRIGQRPSLIFAPREVADAQMKNGKLYIRLFGLSAQADRSNHPGLRGALQHEAHDTEMCRDCGTICRWCAPISMFCTERGPHDT